MPKSKYSPTLAAPKTLGAALKMGLTDMAKVEVDPKYEIQMNEWHRWQEHREVCMVCLAGSVMAVSLEVPRDQSEWPVSGPFPDEWPVSGPFPDDWKMTLLALSYLRLGDVKTAVFCFFPELKKEFDTPEFAPTLELIRSVDRKIPPYEGNHFVDPTKSNEEVDLEVLEREARKQWWVNMWNLYGDLLIAEQNPLWPVKD